MEINIRQYLNEFVDEHSLKDKFQFPDVTLDTTLIKTIMINEIVPYDSGDDFYGKNTMPDYLTTTLPLFAKAGFQGTSIEEILAAGVYITNAVKFPKSETTISREWIETNVPILEKELNLFPNLQVIMLMGDVAKKAFNMITKTKTKKNAVPSMATYKLRDSQLYYENKRIFPSYIMTGKNILIEKSKVEMASEDIKNMLEIIQQQ